MDQLLDKLNRFLENKKPLQQLENDITKEDMKLLRDIITDIIHQKWNGQFVSVALTDLTTYENQNYKPVKAIDIGSEYNEIIDALKNANCNLQYASYEVGRLMNYLKN